MTGDKMVRSLMKIEEIAHIKGLGGMADSESAPNMPLAANPYLYYSDPT